MSQSYKPARIAPYATLLTASAYLYYRAHHFDYTQVPERIGPDAWPRMILLLLMVICSWQILRLAISSSAAQLKGIAPILDEEPDMSSLAEPPHNAGKVWLGIMLTFVFLVAFETLGFFTASFIYLVALMFVGGYRRVVTALVVSLATSLIFIFIFMKIVYVSLPLGRGPFLEVSVAVTRLLGIH